MNVRIFHVSGLYLFSTASFADARKKCSAQRLVTVSHSIRKGVMNFYVTEERAIESQQ